MHIEVARIPPQGLSVAGSETGIPGGAGGKDYEAAGPVEYDFKLQYVSGELIVSGSLAVKIKFLCSRCAVSFEKEIVENRFACVFQAPEGNESVGLTEEMREAILCAFPSHPVCRKECKGLCPQCGKDLNEGDCGCVPEKDGRWDALGDLKLK